MPWLSCVTLGLVGLEPLRLNGRGKKEKLQLQQVHTGAYSCVRKASWSLLLQYILQKR